MKPGGVLWLRRGIRCEVGRMSPVNPLPPSYIRLDSGRRDEEECDVLLPHTSLLVHIFVKLSERRSAEVSHPYSH